MWLFRDDTWITNLNEQNSCWLNSIKWWTRMKKLKRLLLRSVASRKLLWQWHSLWNNVCCITTSRMIHFMLHAHNGRVLLQNTKGKHKGKVVPVLFLNEHHTMKAYWVSGGIAPLILWPQHFMPWLLYPQGRSPWYPLDRRLGGPQSHSGHGGEEKNSQPPPGIAPSP